MTATSPRLVKWENGTDLVIELPLAVELSTVWSKLVDSEIAGAWFAPFTVDAAANGAAASGTADSEGGADSEGDEEANPAISFDLGETELHGEILSVETEDHILVEFDDFGVLGIQLLGIQLTDGDATLLVFTQSAPDVESARFKAADFGPMWDTHLRLFARVLGLEAAEFGEAELLALYADLELEDSEDSEDGANEG